MLYLAILTVILYLRAVQPFSCKDQSNKDVDWFMALKLPKNAENKVSGESAGHAFYYMDYNNKKFVASANSIEKSNQAIAYTLQQVYNNKNGAEVFYTMYNDEPAASASLLEMVKAKLKSIFGKNDPRSVEFGHTKGVLLFNKQQGFWLVHSVPLFPPPNKYAYPDTATTYGQNLLCMTFPYSQLTHIGTQLYYNHPDTYLTLLPTDIASAHPDLAKAVAHEYKSGTPTSSVLDLTTVKGLVFKSFAKTHEYGKDLYEHLVAPKLACGLNVETWKRGDEIPLTCPAPTNPVFDVQNVKILTSAEFKYTNDHSKYAVSRSASSPYVCNGDINRMTSQYVRGGGTVCFHDNYVWNAYSGNLVNENSC